VPTPFSSRSPRSRSRVSLWRVKKFERQFVHHEYRITVTSAKRTVASVKPRAARARATALRQRVEGKSRSRKRRTPSGMEVVEGMGQEECRQNSG